MKMNLYSKQMKNKPGVTWFKLYKFGAPFVQDEIKEQLGSAEFEKFQEKLIETTNKSYDELKDYWTIGEVIETEKAPEVSFDSYVPYLTIHIDKFRKEYMGIIDDRHEISEDYDNNYYLVQENPTEEEPHYDGGEKLFRIFEIFRPFGGMPFFR